MKKYKDISSQACLDVTQIQRFAKHQMEGTEKQLVEKHLVDCDFCKDAVEGAMAFPEDFEMDVKEINEAIDKRTGESAHPYLYWSVAAVISLLIISTVVIWRGSREVSTSQLSVIQEVPPAEPKVLKDNPVQILPKINESYHVVSPKNGRESARKASGTNEKEEVSTGTVSTQAAENISSDELPVASSAPAGNAAGRVASVPRKPDELTYLPSEASISNEMLAMVAPSANTNAFKMPASAKAEPRMEMESQKKRLKKENAPVSASSVATDEAEAPLPSFKSAYERGDYNAVLMLLQQQKDSSHQEWLKYAVLAELKLQQTDKARIHIDKLIKTGNPDAYWLKSIALLQKGKREEAVVVLRTLASNTGPYKELASTVLEKLGYKN